MSNIDLNLFGAELVELLTGYWVPKSLNYRDPHFCAQYGQCVGKSALNQLMSIKESHGLRISQLGKPAVVQAAQLSHISEELQTLGLDIREKKDLRMIELLHRGDQWEEWVTALATIRGFPPITQQKEVEYMGVKGHIDFLLDLGSGPVVVEVKTMSGNYFNQFSRHQNDDRGYLTQLTCYSKALGLPGVWLCLDKSTHNVKVIPHPGEAAAQQVEERLSRIIPKLQSISCLKDVFEQFAPPPPVAEVFKRADTGRWLVPPSMRWSPVKYLFYKISSEMNGYGKPTEYVVGVNNYDEATEFLKSCTQLETSP